MPTSKLNNTIQPPESLKPQAKSPVSYIPISNSSISNGSISNSSISDVAVAKQSLSLQGMIEELIDGILILTAQRELVYLSSSARRLLEPLTQNQIQTNLIPKEIWHVCQSLIQSRSLFPNQHWLMESDIFTEDAIALHIRARWLKVESIEHPCLLLTVEDRHQALKNIAAEEAEKYGLTPREKEVWLLHRANYTYKQIATELCITPNTVKKHMKHIHAKQKDGD